MQTLTGLASLKAVSMSWIKNRAVPILLCSAASMREWPEAKLFLADLPQAGQAARLDDQEEDDQRTEHDHLDIRHQSGRQGSAQQALERPGCAIEKDRQERNEGSAEKGSQDAACPPDDHHEQDAERKIEVERLRLHRAQIGVCIQGSCDAAVKRADGESQQLGSHDADADDFGGDVHVAYRHPGAAD